MTSRPATPDDAVAIARIYNEGIEDRMATFETQPRVPEDIRAWFDGIHPAVVVEDAGEVIAFATTSKYHDRACYAGIAEVSVYVARAARGRGAGAAGDRRADPGCGGSRVLETGVPDFRGKHRQPRPDPLRRDFVRWASTKSTDSSTERGGTS